MIVGYPARSDGSGTGRAPVPDSVVTGEARGANCGEWPAPAAADMALTLFESLRGYRPGWLRGDCTSSVPGRRMNSVPSETRSTRSAPTPPTPPTTRSPA
jgi:hypothetical protein